VKEVRVEIELFLYYLWAIQAQFGCFLCQLFVTTFLVLGLGESGKRETRNGKWDGGKGPFDEWEGL